MNRTEQVIKAARNWKNWGSYAVTRYCENRGIDLRLVRLARQLEAATKAGF